MPPPEPPNQPDLSATSHTGYGEKDRLHLPPTPSSNGDAIKTENPKPSVSPDDGSPLKTFLLLASVFLAMFLVAVDRTIISTAIPQITNEFNSLDDVGWYGSIYLLTCCAFQLLFGKLYSIYDAKLVLLTSILIFEVASAVCGAAPTSVAFIVGRAISGVGSAGIFAGTIVTIVHSIPLAKRPRIQGLMGGIMGLATVIGPLIGGGFTSRVSWRWCFYINLPFGGVAVLAIVAFFHVPNKRPHGKLSILQQLMLLDLPGTVALVPAVVCLLLALQWGGQQYAWNNKYIITLLTLMAVFFVAFAMAQILLPKTATVPPRLLKQRSVAAAFLTTTAVGSSQYIFVYYLPIWFQAVKGISAVQSGIHLLGLMVAFVLASITGGLLNQKIGYYTVLGIAGASMMSIGAGLLTTLQLTTTQGKMIGYQILYGFGMGLCFQTPNLATQTVLPKPEVPMGIALMFFGQLLGAAVFVAVGQNVLANQLLKRLSGVDAFDKLKPLILSGGATSVVDAAPSAQRSMVLAAYNSALRQVFIVGLVLSCLAVLGTATMEWKSILKKPQPEAGVAQQTGASAKASADGKV